MNASSPSAVVHSSCLSSSTCNSTARQATASNVGLPYSPFRRFSTLSPGGCALSLSSAAANPSFFHIPHRRRKHSTKTVFVVKGSSSTFEVDEERKRHGVQIAESARERGGHATKGRVSWSPNGKPTILWGTQTQQDKASRSHAKRQSSGAHEDKKGDEFTDEFGSQHGPPGPSVGEHKNSIPWQNEQRAFRLAHTIPKRPSSPTRQESELFNPSSASRLLIRSPAFKQAAETDAHGPPVSPVKGAVTSFTRNEDSQFQGGAHMHEAPPYGEDTPQGGSVFTSKLEEILNNFRTRQKREDSRTRQKCPDDHFEEGGAAPSDLLSSTSKVVRKGSNLNSTHSWKSARKVFQSINYGGFIHKTSAEDVDASEESFATIEGHQSVPHGERRFTTEQQNTRGNNTDYDPLDPIDNSPATPWRAEGGRLSVSQMHSPVRKGSSTFVERQTIKSSRLQHNSGNSYSESKARGWGNDNKKSRTERPYTSRMNQTLQVQKSVDHKLDVDAEDSVDIASPITSDSEDNGSYPTQSEKAKEQKQASSAGFNTSECRPLIKNAKASWQSDSIPSLPFEVQYSYSETPNAPVIRYRERPYSPFGPSTLSRPWTGGPPKKKSKKNLPLFDSFNPPPKGKKGIKHVQDPGPYPEGQGPKPSKSRDEILGEPLNAQEIAQLIDGCQNENRQLNLGRDGLTHNMLDLVHCHWKRRRVIKFRCLGVPTVDMDNVCFHLEDKTGGKIIYRSGGIVYLFRGRNYNYRDRPEIPLMLWKPLTPVYPKLIKRAPEGLTEEEADQLRQLGKKVEPLCTLSKNGVYLNLVNDVRAAFKVDKLARIDCRGLNPSDYKKIGAKLKDLVPCVLLSFNDEQILMWKGKETLSTDVGSLKGLETAEGFTEESSVSHVESTSISMNDSKPEVSANVSRAESNDSCSGTEEIRQAFSSLEGFNNHATVPWSADGEGENATVAIDGSPTSSWSLDNGHASDVTGATLHISHPELSLEEFTERDLKASSEVNSSLHMVLEAQDELDLNEPNLAFRDTRLQVENDTRISRHAKEKKALPDDTCIEKGEYRESRLLTKDHEREVAALQALALESRSTSLERGENVGATEDDACVVVRVDDLWDQAITSGNAIQLDDVEIDTDIVAKKASELAKTVPYGEVYTRKLMWDLTPKTGKIFRPEHELHKHLKNIKKMRLEKKLSKRSFRIRTADVPKDLPEDEPRNSGMPVDELARLLSIT